MRQTLSTRLFVLALISLSNLVVTSTGLSADKGYSVPPRSNVRPFPEMPSLLSYESLMELQPEYRNHYLNQLGLLMADMANTPHSSGSDVFAENATRGLLELFLSTVVANAAAADATSYPDFQIVTNGGRGAAASADKCSEPKTFAKDDKDCEAHKSVGVSSTFKPKTCVFAGNILDAGKNGKCKAPTSICLSGDLPSSGKCSDGKKPLTCDQGTVACNPTIFGVLKNGNGYKPLCVPVGGSGGSGSTRDTSSYTQSATRSCGMYNNSASSSNKDLRYFVSYGAADQNKAAWDKLKHRFENLCGAESEENGAGVTRNCETCKVVRRRLMAMNTLADYASKNKVALNPDGSIKTVDGKTTPPTCKWDDKNSTLVNGDAVKSGTSSAQKSMSVQ